MKQQTNKLPYRGIIEGFYGPLWTHEDRLHLLRHMPQWNMNLYIYAPKNDPLHRFRWEVLYPADEMKKFQELARVARREKVMLSIAISPGNSFEPQRKQHRRLLLQKINQFIDLGCEFFPILYDDLHGFTDFQSSAAIVHAEKQAELMNDLAAEIVQRVPRARFLFCPTEYGTAQSSPYLARLHELLDPRVEVICTGMDGPGYQVFSHTISNEGAETYFRNFGRKPFIWDNFNTSDWTLNALHWSPFTGRGNRLDELCAGIVLNPQNIYRINWPVFGTVGQYFANPRQYNPQAAMKRELAEGLGKDGALVGRVLAQWYTSEIPGYISSRQNLPNIDGGFDSSQEARRQLLQEIKDAVAPLLNFEHVADHAIMPPDWAGHLLAYSQLLKWWSYSVNDLCNAALEVFPVTEDCVTRTTQALTELRGYSYRLPASLLTYLETLLDRLT